MNITGSRVLKSLCTKDARSADTVVCVGGAGSSKSYSVAQLLCMKLATEQGKRFYILRKTLPSLKLSCFPLMMHLIDEYKLQSTLNKTELRIEVAPISGGKPNTIVFKSLDDPEKLKSLYEPNYVWVEEASEVSLADYKEIKRRVRGPNELKNQVFLTLNPVECWIREELCEIPREGVYIDYSTYKDNPFLAGDYITTLESERDKYHRDVYTLGKWSVPEHIIYNNWDVVPEGRWPTSFDAEYCGLDFGFNDPTALVAVGERDQEIYLRQMFYANRHTNTMLIKALHDLIPERSCKEIYADSEDPNRIQEICDAGYNCIPAPKGQGSVREGIDHCRRRMMHVHPLSVDLIKELKGYCYKTDKDGHVLEEPASGGMVKDHACDAFRYAIFTHATRNPGEVRLIGA